MSPLRKKHKTATKPVARSGPSQAQRTALHGTGRTPAGSAPVAFALSPVQLAPVIGRANDRFEREADGVADRVTAGLHTPAGDVSRISPGGLESGSAQRQPDGAASDEEEVQTAALQREEEPQEESVQTVPIQRREDSEEEPVQALRLQRQEDVDEEPIQALRLQRQEDQDDLQAKPVQRQDKPEEEPVQALPLQRQDDEEEPVQALGLQRQEEAEEEPVQTAGLQRQETQEDEPVQTLGLQLQEEDEEPIQAERFQRQEEPEEEPLQGKPLQRQVDDEEEPVQALTVQREGDEEEPLQAKSVQRQEGDEVEEKPVQASPFQRETDEAEEPVQADSGSASDGGSAGMHAAAASALSSKGSGEPLRSDVASTLGSHMGADFSDVRVHDDSSAHDTARALNARAFTHGSDIWLGRGESQSDTHLMAHEATHVVQQTGGVHRQLIQRAKGGGKKKKKKGKATVATLDTPGGKVATSKYGVVDDALKTITIPQISLPTFKVKKMKEIGKLTEPLELPRKSAEAKRKSDQANKWEKAVLASAALDAALDKKLEKADKVPAEGKEVYFLKLKKAKPFVIGTKADIKQRVARPFWTRAGVVMGFQVDHIKELQLGGQDEVDNMWLLQGRANMSSGGKIKGEIGRRIRRATTPVVGPLWTKPKDIKKEIRPKYKVIFKTVKPGLGVKGDPSFQHTLTQTREGGTLAGLRTLKPKERKDVIGSDKELKIFTSKTGDERKTVDWKDAPASGQHRKTNLSLWFGSNFVGTEVMWDKDAKSGTMSGTAFPSKSAKKKAAKAGKVFKPTKLAEPLTITKLDWLSVGGFIPFGSVTHAARSAFDVSGLSPVEIEHAELSPGKGLVARGRVLPTLPFFKDLALDLVIDGDLIELRHTFSTGDFDIPGPIDITDSSITIAIGSEGLALSGDLFFEIQRLGSGSLMGRVSTAGSLGLVGTFDFDTSLFDPATVKLSYMDGKFSGEGTLGIKKGTVPGIKSATIKASFDEDKIAAVGSADLAVPGLEKGTLAVSYSKKDGFSLGGSFQLSKDIPGIKGGSVEATVKKKPGEEGWDVWAKGTAQPAIPGINALLTVEYANGAITIEGTASYAKGLLKGKVMVGATNRPVDDEGKPTDGEPTKKMTAYGSGTVTIQITPWLAGTVGVKLLRNGEIEVSGKIGLPSSLEIFPEKKLKKNFFTINIDIPIIGFSVAGVRVGIFATIGGGLDAEAGIGPGELQKLELGVTYNPDHEDETHVTGGAKLHIPAHAGLRLFVRGGIGAGIPLVSATAGLEIGAGLGLEGAIEAGVEIDWTPKKGLSLDAMGRIYVQPKFKFDVTGFVEVTFDYFIGTKTLYDKKWKLKEFEYGSDLRFGIKFPIKYRENEPFDVSLSDVEFEVPKIDTKSLLKGLVKKII